MRSAILISLVFWSAQLIAKPSKEYIEQSIIKAAETVGISAKLLRAICMAESNLRPEAYVYGDGGSSNHAFGMCQVLRLTAAKMGLKDDNCEQNFIEKPRSYQTCKLFGPYTNAYYAARYLKYQLDRYDGSWISAIAAYNSGSVKTCSVKGYYVTRAGAKVSCKPGGLINQRYVDRVLEAIQEPTQYPTEKDR